MSCNVKIENNVSHLSRNDGYNNYVYREYQCLNVSQQSLETEYSIRKALRENQQPNSSVKSKLGGSTDEIKPTSSSIKSNSAAQVYINVWKSL
jgi:hypothetical protein